jgi:hypothetical protein
MLLSKTNSYKIPQKEKSILEPIPEKTFEYSLGGYTHRERWARTRRNFIFQGNKRRREKTYEVELLPSGENAYYSRLDNPKIFRIETVKQG